MKTGIMLLGRGWGAADRLAVSLGQAARLPTHRQSYQRVVARCTLPDGRSLSCATIAAGAAVRWDRYWRQYGMGECR